MSFKNGIVGAVSFDGASVFMKFYSSSERSLLSSGKDVTILFQKKYQKNPSNPNK